jgi:hypothetical protein
MKRAVAAAAAIGALVAAFLVSGAVASHGSPGVKTHKPAYLQPHPESPGVVIDPILSTGDIVPEGQDPDYQMSGIPDGLGAYPLKDHGRWHWFDDGRSKKKFVVVMNHELDRTFPTNPIFNPNVDARISRLVIDREKRAVHEAEYLFTGLEGYTRFCSSTLRMIRGEPFYFTGEETSTSGHRGSSIVMDPETGMWKETRHFGLLQHENVVPLRIARKWVFLTSDDDFRPGFSYLYAWIGDSFNESLKGNDASDGSLYVWKADNHVAEPGNATATKGESIPGHFVPLSQIPDNATGESLKLAAARENAFKFDRLEDIAVLGGTQSPSNEHVTFIADTGKPPVTTRGRVYQFTFNRNDPTRATLKMILNGDAPDNDDIFNPDNMDASDRVLMIQEDRESAFRGDPSRILAYDFRSKDIRTVATVRTPDLLGPFTWEASGIIDASHVLGKDWWLTDVQAHSLSERQPGPTLVPNSEDGEDGQLLAIKVPGSQGGGGDDDDDDGGDDDDDDD